ncbi:MAG: ATP-binding protein [Minicystis sp.]
MSGDRGSRGGPEAGHDDAAGVRALLERVPDPVFVYQDLRIAYVNTCAASYLGYASADDLIGLPVAELIERHARPEVRDRWEARLTDNSGRDFVRPPEEAHLVRLDGSTVTAERHGAFIEWRGLPAQMTVLRDITARVAAEQALRRSEENFRLLIEHAPHGIAVTAGDRVVYANPRLLAFIGYSGPDPLLDQSALGLADLLIHPDDRHRLQGIRTPPAPGAAPHVTLDVRIRHRDGGYRFADLVMMASSFDGSPAAVTHVLDRTERKAMEAQLVQADRLATMGRLAASVVHEINSPLAYLLANLEFVASRLGGIDDERLAPLREPMERACEGATRVRRIVQDLRSLARGDDEPAGAADVRAVLDACASLADADIRRRARVVRAYADVPPARGSEARLGQVFLNLLLNAAHACGERAAEQHEIRLVVRRAEDRVIVEVQDDGEGIPPEHLGRLFDPFFTTKPASAGMGLGLSICHTLVTRLGGEIRVESELGRGTTVFVALPVAAAEET